MFKKILVPLDGSKKSYKALEIACELALKLDAEINILSVFKHHSFMEASLSMMKGRDELENLDEILSQYSKEIVSKGKEMLTKKGLTNVRGFVKVGTAAKEILEFAKEHENDLIVIGSQGHGDLSGYLLGGVSHKVTGLAKCPVMVV
ncbi:MAG: universal stress protein [Campylobacterales bacterium]